MFLTADPRDRGAEFAAILEEVQVAPDSRLRVMDRAKGTTFRAGEPGAAVKSEFERQGLGIAVKGALLDAPRGPLELQGHREKRVCVHRIGIPETPAIFSLSNGPHQNPGL